MSDPGFASLGPTLLARKGGAKPAMRPQLAPLVQDEAELAALADEQLEDLGWNDMGGEEADHHDAGADIVPINAAVAADAAEASGSPIVRRQQRRLEERVLADAAMTGPDDAEADDETASDADDSDDYAVNYSAASAEDEAFEDEYDFEDEDEDASEDSAEQDFAPLAPSPVVAKKPVAARVAVAPRAASAKSSRRAAFTLRLDAERHLKLRLAATMQGVSAQALVTEALDALLAEFDDLDVIAAHLKRH